MHRPTTRVITARLTRRVLGLAVLPLALWTGAAPAFAGSDAYGVDVSHYNPLIDPAAVAGNGIRFAYVKATEGTGWTDTTYTGTSARLRAAGILIGAYHYADGPDCAAEGRWFAAHSGGTDLVPALDMEAAPLAADADQCVTSFFDAMHAPKMIVYGNSTWWAHYLHPPAWGQRPIIGWIASYTGQPGAPAGSNPVWVVHQHSDHGNVPGFASQVDRDAIMPGHTLNELTAGAPMPPMPPAPPVRSTPSEVYVVRPGDTLTAIGARLGVPWKYIADRNGILPPYRIFPGQTLAVGLVPTFVLRVYTVHSGDTLSAIGTRLGVPWRTLASKNHIAAPYRIFPGQTLTY